MASVSVEHVARIEGHGTISIDVSEGVVREVRFDVIEPARFFESMVVGRRFEDIPLITSRICGICSPNHALTAVKAIEDAFGVEVSERTEKLRKLLVYGSYLQNHATHLYLFAAPDFVGLPSVLPLAETHPQVVERALSIKKLGNRLTTLIAGRPVHPITAVVGGFTSEPSLDQLETLARDLRRAVPAMAETVDLFSAFSVPEFETAGEMLALREVADYAIYDGDTAALEGGWSRPVREYRDFLGEEVVSHGNAKHSFTGESTFMVGALPRINLSSTLLTATAAEALRSTGLAVPSRNPFFNNLCQAIELVDAAERCAGFAEDLLEEGGSASPVSVEVRAGRGVGATEAPRGTLYHAYEIDDGGVVRSGDIVTPTAQNLANLEADMRGFAPTVVDLPREDFVLALEQLVRSYDPCLSCSVH